MVSIWQCYFYVTDGWSVYPGFIPAGDQIVNKTANRAGGYLQLASGGCAYMTRVEGENTRLRHYLARLHRKTLCYSKSVDMLKHSLRLLLHYLKFQYVPVPA
jgi:IS1 family transposase